jgi:hypothetical protein
MSVRLIPPNGMLLVRCVLIASILSVPAGMPLAQDTTEAHSPNMRPLVQQQTETAPVEVLQEDELGGRARRNGRRARRPSRTSMLSRLTGLLALLGVAGSAYAIYRLRGLSRSVARLSDTVSSQARQLNDMRRSGEGE